MLQEELLSRIRRIEIQARRSVDSYLQGAYHTLFKGQGLEFQEVREYTDDDDARRIDWNVTARMNKPFVKVFREERELTVMLVVDISRSTIFGKTLSGREVMATLAASIAFSAIRNGDKAGLLLFSNRVEEYIPPRRGRNHLLHIIRTLLTAESQEQTTAPDEAIRFYTQVLRKKSLMFFISDMFFGALPDSFKIASRKHEIIPIALYDAAYQKVFTRGAIRIEDPETGKIELIDAGKESKEAWDRFVETKNSEFARLRLSPLWIENKDKFINDLILGFRKMEKRGRR